MLAELKRLLRDLDRDLAPTLRHVECLQARREALKAAIAEREAAEKAVVRHEKKPLKSKSDSKSETPAKK
jgi:hypothetical protein